MRSRVMKRSLRRPHRGQVLTRLISHAQQVRVPRLRWVNIRFTPFLVAAEYLAKGYTLSDQVLQRAIELDSTCLSSPRITLSPSILTTAIRRFSSRIEKQGISKRFIDYINSIDSTLGQKALGPDQTISGKVQSSVNDGINQAKSFNEEKGVTKRIGDVSALLPLFVPMRY